MNAIIKRNIKPNKNKRINKTTNTRKKKRKYLTKRQRRIYRKRQLRIRIALLVIVVLLVIAGIILLTKHPADFPLSKDHINSACKSYRPTVERVADQYDMSDYVDLILAVMMQESSGEGNDVMQSAEGAFNHEYPQEPNGITDPEYSIQCGIQELKYAMNKANVSSPDDLEPIKLALQGYNFGADVYFDYMNKNGYNYWTEENAQEFAKHACNADERSDDNPLKKTAGPWNYGDQYYPLHVLRYYHPD